MTPLRVVSLQVRDVLGAREFALEPGRITVLRGKNGSGKSSALAAVQKALEGGNLARLARVAGPGEDEPEPEVVLVLHGEGPEAYRVRRKGDKVDVRARVGDTQAFEAVGKPVQWLRSLFDPQGANPVSFLQAKDADRALMLLEALPLRMDRAALLADMGIEASILPPIPAGVHPLEECALIRDAVFNRRRGVNVDERSKRGSAEQIRRQIPAAIPDEKGSDVAALDADVGALARDLGARETAARAEHDAAFERARTDHAEAEAKVTSAYRDAARKLRSDFETWAETRRREVEQEIAAKKASVDAEVEARKEEDNARLAALDAVRDAAQAAAHEAATAAAAELAGLRNTLQAKREQLAALREGQKAAAGHRALAAQADDFDEQATTLKGESERLTKALDALDAFRRRLTDDLPIPGLSIEDKVIRVNGIPFDQLNTAQRVDLAVRVSCMRAAGSRLPVVFVDGAEALDEEHFALLVDRLKAAGVQAFVGRVDEGDLKVETERGDAQ